MSSSSHLIIAAMSGAVAVNVETPVVDSMFSYSVLLGVAIFCLKGVTGAAISIIINSIVDLCKRKFKKKDANRS